MNHSIEDIDTERLELEVIYYASKGNLERLKELVTKKGVSLSCADYDRRTPLHLAASEGHFETVRWLLENGVDPNPIDRFSNTPLVDSVRHRHEDISKYLTSKGGKMPLQSSTRDSSELCQAAKDGDLTKVKALVESGIHVNLSDYDARTALHIAACEGHYEIAQYLVNIGANVNVADRWGVTPLKEALTRNHTKIVDLFRSSGAIVVDVTKFKTLPGFVSSMQQSLILLCEKQKWEYGCAWVLSDDKKLLIPTNAWYADSAHVNGLALYHQTQTPIPYGKGVVGSTAKTHIYLWMESHKRLAATVYFPETATETGFKSGFAFPVMYNTEIVAVLEFYSFTERPPNQEVIQDSMRMATSIIITEILSSLTAKQELSSKNEQSHLVYRLVISKGTFAEASVSEEVDWFYNQLGLPPSYFKIHPPQLIAKHILAFITAKLYSKDSGLPINYRLEEQGYALYFTDSSSIQIINEVERAIEEKYLGEGNTTVSEIARPPSNKGIYVSYFLSTGSIHSGTTSKLAMHCVSADLYVNPKPNPGEVSISQVSTGAFLRDVEEASKQKYQRAISECMGNMSVRIFREKDSLYKDCQLVQFVYPRGNSHSYYSSLTSLMKIYHLTCPFKAVREFSNGFNVYMIYLSGSSTDIDGFVDSANLLYILPRTALFPLFEEGKLNAEEVVYAYAGWKFVYHFLNKSSEEFTQLLERLRDDETNKNRLIRLKQTTRNEAATEAKVLQVIMSYPEIIRECYATFRAHFKPGPKRINQRILHNLNHFSNIEKKVPVILDAQILQAFLTLNESVLKTNFYKSNKSALSMQLEPSFLANSDYPVVPYSIFLFFGAEFRGFHVRFEPIARGGIRLIKSANTPSFLKNAENLFSENFNLALTQQKKNKDIPEGGSKGTILLSMTHQKKHEIAFRKYIDSMLDLLLVGTGIKDPEIVDYLQKDDIIFCGPDEGTADLMDWAALHAKSRGYRYWSAFTTGKSTRLGGIPHDIYGMTTRGVHQFVLGALEKQNLREEDVIKVQTGGPDGDLGSNEILISKDRTKAIVDGSGVLYDKNGIDRQELTRLAHHRLMVEHFDRRKLSKDGFLVLLSDKDVYLPDGTKVENGMLFRNSFHITHYASCDLFVPCGGRPESITIHNVNKLFHNGDPIFKTIVEGANLFFTQEARLVLEKAGVPVLKDASANKGGVTSSSLEVLAALCFTNEEHERNMCVKNDVIPQFYKDYVVEVQKRIENNARLEFDCIWSEHSKTKIPMCTLSDRVSEKINILNQTISNSNLWGDSEIKKKVLAESLPQTLQKLLGIDEIVRRLPESYISATLSSHLASRYIYKYGLNPGDFSFYEFMQQYQKPQSKY